MSVETNFIPGGVDRIAGYLSRYNGAIRRGEQPPAVGEPLTTSEQHRVERFLWLADPQGRTARKIASYREASEVAGQQPTASPDTHGSLDEHNREKLQDYLATFTEGAVEAPTIPKEGEQ
jgi:hypothetical protein